MRSFLAMLGRSPAAIHHFTSFDDTSKEGGAYQHRSTYDESIPWLVEQQRARRGVFVSVQGMRGEKRAKTEACEARALFVDFDSECGVASPVPVSARVESSPGREHLYWFLREGEDVTRVDGALRALIEFFASDPVPNHRACVMRIPGSVNWKTGVPRGGRVVELHADRRYTIDEVLRGLREPMYPRAYAERKLWEICRDIRAAEEGSRNATLNKLAWVARGLCAELGDDRVREAVTDAAYSLECSDFRREEIDRTIQSAWDAETVPEPVGAASTSGIEPMPSKEVHDIAMRWMQDHGRGDGHLLSTGATVWRYSPDTGTWSEIPVVMLRSSLQEMHGTPYWAASKDGPVVKSLSIPPYLRDQVVSYILHDASLVRLDAFTKAPAGVACRDGFIRLTGTRIAIDPHRPANYARSYVDVTLRGAKPTGAWQRFLGEVWAGDTESPRVLQDIIGSALFGKATDLAKCVLLQGDGANGKSVLLEALSDTLFAGATSYVPPHTWGDQYARRTLMGAKLNVAGELPTKRWQHSDVFKGIVTGDQQQARLPYGQPEYFRPEALHVFATNHLPPSEDCSEGFWRRFVLLPMTQSFVGRSRPASELLADLQADTYSILVWAIEGALRVAATGQVSTSTVGEVESAGWREDVDTVQAFVSLACDRDGEQPRTSSRDVYEVYRQWCISREQKPLSLPYLSRRLRSLGVEKYRTMTERGFLLRVLPFNQQMI